MRQYTARIAGFALCTAAVVMLGLMTAFSHTPAQDKGTEPPVKAVKEAMPAKAAPGEKGPRITLPSGWSKLHLTNEQKAKVYSIRQGFKEKIDKLEDAIATHRADERNALTDILTTAQREQLARQLGLSGKAAPTALTTEKK